MPQSSFHLLRKPPLWAGIYLLANALAHSASLLAAQEDLAALVLASWVAPWIYCFVPQWRRAAIFVFGVLFPLFGSHSYSTYNQAFELLLSQLGVALCLVHLKEKPVPINKGLSVLAGAFFLAAVFSMALLPLEHLWGNFWHWGFFDFTNYVLTAPASWPEYSLAAVNRLALFLMVLHLFSGRPRAREEYRTWFIGLAAGALFAALVGVTKQMHLIPIPLEWYRETLNPHRLQSFFRNPGWFAEFILVTTPFAIIVFLKKIRGKGLLLALFGALLTGQLASLLTASRTSWFLYPVILFGCWLIYFAYHDSKEGHKPRKLFKPLFLALVSVLVTLIVSVLLLSLIFNWIHAAPDGQQVQQRGFFQKRVGRITTNTSRELMWKDALNLVRESPLFGLGYESYAYRVPAFEKLTDSLYYKHRLSGRRFETPHNFYLSTLISLGFVGLWLWLSLIFYLAALLLWDALTKRRKLPLAILLSLIGFHLYGLTQSMQYISMVWFVAFLGIGYGLTLEEPQGWAKARRSLLGLNGALALAVVGYALFNPGLRTIRERYQVKNLFFDSQLENYQGFYPLENWGGVPYRWSGTKSRFYLEDSGVLELFMVSSNPQNDKRPTVVDIFFGDCFLDRITFHRPMRQKLRYFFPGPPKRRHFRLTVSHTWTPADTGTSGDRRRLGVALGDVSFHPNFPIGSVGLHGLEEWPQIGPVRWMKARASFPLMGEEATKGVHLKLFRHPLAGDRLLIMGERGFEKEVTLKLGWQEVDIPGGALWPGEILTLQTDSSFKPKARGNSTDDRDLALALKADLLGLRQ